MPHLTFWFEYASTYSHLSAQRIAPLAEQSGVAVTWRPFLLGPIFREMGWQSSPFNQYPAKGAYMWRDMARRAERYGLPPIQRPDPFPQHSLLAARIGTLGMAHGWGEAFTRALYHAQFSEGQDIADDAVLAACLAPLGVNAAKVLEQAKTDEDNKTKLRAASDQAVELGLFGAPNFVTDDSELFWGDDRLEDALYWALDVAGKKAARDE